MPGKVSKMDVTLAPPEHGQIYRYLSHIASIQGIVKQGCLTLVLLSENLNHTITASQPLHHTATCLVKCYCIFRGGGGGGWIPTIGIEPEKYANKRRFKIIQLNRFTNFIQYIFLPQSGRETLNKNTGTLYNPDSCRLELTYVITTSRVGM